MRGDSGGEGGLAGPEAEPAGHVGIREAAPTLGEEERVLARVVGEGAAAFVEIAAQGALGGLADWKQPLLRALAEDAQLLGLEVERADIEVDDLLAAQAAGVGELEHRPVPQLQRRPRRDPLQQRAHLLGGEDVWQLLRTLWAGDELGGVGAGAAGADEKAEEAADRRQLAGDGCRRGAGAGETGAVAAHVAVADVGRPQPLLACPLAEAAEVDAVRAPRPLSRPPRPQVAVIQRKRLFPVHGTLIRPRRPSSCARLVTDIDRRPDFYEIVEFFDVGNRHPDAAVRTGGAQRVGLFGAVDPGAFVDPHPASLDRIRGPRRDRLSGE